jgi:hypothetical protein
MLKAISDWIKHLFHLHNWIDEERNSLIHERGSIPYGIVYIQKCSICGKRRKQEFC